MKLAAGYQGRSSSMTFKEVEKRREYHRAYYHRQRAEFFDGKVCVQCGSPDNLELDHIDPTQKVSDKIWTWAKARRLTELAKCQVLCHDCHLRKSYPNLDVHGNYKTYDRGCRCDECKAGHAAYRRLERARHK